MDLTAQLLEQLTFHWQSRARPRLEGLRDDEYLWEPVPGCWSIRSRAEATSAMAAGGGDLVIDFAWPEPEPAPVTTIAWRLGHVIVGVFGARNAAHFGGPPVDYLTAEWAPDASGALTQLDDAYDRWVAGVRGLDEEGLARPVGPAEGDWADLPYVALVLHVHREAIHHLAEVALLRDLHLRQGPAAT
ncbi:MAG TPA: DinB family protein [Acidimicrobiales bacterium]|nr:DinB family protein [Acidimicrobiales bacterium]